MQFLKFVLIFTGFLLSFSYLPQSVSAEVTNISTDGRLTRGTTLSNRLRFQNEYNQSWENADPTAQSQFLNKLREEKKKDGKNIQKTKEKKSKIKSQSTKANKKRKFIRNRRFNSKLRNFFIDNKFMSGSERAEQKIERKPINIARARTFNLNFDGQFSNRKAAFSNFNTSMDGNISHLIDSSAFSPQTTGTFENLQAFNNGRFSHDRSKVAHNVGKKRNFNKKSLNFGQAFKRKRFFQG